jgi:glyoxylase-like metal-dependent hydrolase (beta-lactamase superfamily II)
MEVASGIHRMGSGFVNWFLVQEGQRLTVVDAGLPGQWPQLVAGLASMGRSLADVDALVLTHAHVDHVGFGSRLEQESRATVRVHTSEAGTAVRKFEGGPYPWPHRRKLRSARPRPGCRVHR